MNKVEKRLNELRKSGILKKTDEELEEIRVSKWTKERQDVHYAQKKVDRVRKEASEIDRIKINRGPIGFKEFISNKAQEARIEREEWKKRYLLEKKMLELIDAKVEWRLALEAFKNVESKQSGERAEREARSKDGNDFYDGFYVPSIAEFSLDEAAITTTYISSGISNLEGIASIKVKSSHTSDTEVSSSNRDTSSYSDSSSSYSDSGSSSSD